MSKKLIATLIVFIVLLGIFIFVNTAYLNTSKPPTVVKKKPQPYSIPVASLSLLPNPITVSSSKSASLNIVMSGNLPENRMTIAQIELSYDPLTLFGVSITPGNYFIDPQITLSSIDYRTGRISYALRGNHSQQGSSIVAQINFTASGYGVLRQTEMKFLPKTLIHTDDGAVNLSETNGASIIVKPSLFQYIPKASPSAVHK